jgi:hypothetical protein
MISELNRAAEQKIDDEGDERFWPRESRAQARVSEARMLCPRLPLGMTGLRLSSDHQQ